MANPRSMTNYKRWLKERETEARATLQAMFPNGRMDMNDPNSLRQDTRPPFEALNDLQAALRVVERFETEVPLESRSRAKPRES